MRARLEPALQALVAKLQLRRRWPDLLGLLLAALYAAPSLTYAFGRDQAIFYYLGREWLHGSIPYRDAFDLKPPAIYLLHTLSIALLGPHIYAIRVVELAGVLSIGWLCALAVQRDTPRVRGEIGLCALLTASWYYSTFDFWDTGQVEIWEGLCLLAAYVLIKRTQELVRGAFFAGVLASVAIMFKFTAGVVAVLLVLPLLVRALDATDEPVSLKARALRAAYALAAYGAGGVSVVALVVAYYAAHGAIPYLVELMQYIKAYAESAWNPPDPWALVKGFWLRSTLWVAAFAFAWLIGAAEAGARRAWRVLSGAGMAVLLLLGAAASVAAQRKFFNYHWGVVTPFFALLAAYGLAECARVRPIAAHLTVLGLLVTGFMLAPGWPTNGAMTYRIYSVDHFWEYLRKRIDYNALMAVFVGGQNYNWSFQMQIADTIRARQRPSDMLHVRGFELGIYALTNLRSPSRFVSEIPLDDPALAFNREVWLKEHNDALWSARPRFFVGFIDRLQDDDTIRAHGYHEVQRSGLFLLMERDEPVKAPP